MKDTDALVAQMVADRHRAGDSIAAKTPGRRAERMRGAK
jgi:hypothetical protein